MSPDKSKSISLGSDNHSGIHPQILNKIIECNVGHSPAYGTDEFTEATNKIIKNNFGKSCEPFFVFNGTAANVLCLKSLVQSYESVITSAVSHLQLDECGAPEAVIGCKILTVPSQDGKITIADIKKHIQRTGDQHYSQPRAVSITLPTEYGVCYSLDELKELREFTKSQGLYLHIDGARLIYAAHYLNVDFLTLTEKLGVDAVSFGGTKNGLLFGEIALIYNSNIQKKFKYIRKQGMQVPSKMRFIAAQFSEFFSRSLTSSTQAPLWAEIAEHGHSMAKYLAEGLSKIPEIKITQKVEANSVFVIFPRQWIKPLREQMFFYIWDELTFEARLMLSFDVSKKDIDQFLNLIQKLKDTL